MKIFSSKKRVAAIGLVTAATLVGGGMAYAYWTNSGSGTGSVTAGTASNNLVVTASAHDTAPALVPGGPAVPLDLQVANNNTYSVKLDDQRVAIVTDSIKCDTTEVDDSWFSLASTDISDGTTIPAAVGLVPGVGVLDEPSGVTLVMNDTVDNQNVCQGAEVTFELTVTTIP